MDPGPLVVRPIPRQVIVPEDQPGVPAQFEKWSPQRCTFRMQPDGADVGSGEGHRDGLRPDGGRHQENPAQGGKKRGEGKGFQMGRHVTKVSL